MSTPAAYWRASVTAPGVIEPVLEQGKKRAVNAVRCRVLATGVCGSDLGFVASGAGGPGQVLGHEIVAEVLEAPAASSDIVGQRVMVRPVTGCGTCAYCAAGRTHLCDIAQKTTISFGRPGGYAEQLDVLAPEAGVLAPLGPNVSDLDAVWAEPLAVAIRAVRRARTVDDQLVDDQLVVIAAGPLGLCITAAAASLGLKVTVLEPRLRRREAALQAGALTAFDPSEGRNLRCAQVIVATGAPAALRRAAEIARPGGTVVLAGLGSDRMTPFPGPFTITGSFGYHPEDFARGVELINSGTVALGDCVSHELPLAEIAAFPLLLQQPETLKVVIRP